MASRTLAAILLLISVGIVAGALPAIQKATVQYVELDFFEKKEGHLVFEIEFDSQPYYINHDSIHSYANYNALDINAPMATGLLNCPSTHKNPCNDNPDDPNVGIIALPPSASPVQSIFIALSNALINQFSGDKNEFNWTFTNTNFPTIQAKPNTWAGVAKLWEQDSKTQAYKVCLPVEQLASCPLILFPPIQLPSANINFTGICDSAGNCYNGTTVPYSLKEPKCDATDMATARSEFLNELNFDPISVNNVGQLLIDAVEYLTRSYDEAILGCRDLILSLVTTGPESTTSVTDICHKSLFENGALNPSFVSDPCCNNWAAYYTCCEKRPVTYTRGNIQSILVDKVSQCSNPAAAAGTLLDTHAIIENIDALCGTEQGWGDGNVWFKEVFGPLELCFKEVFDKPCAAAQDCPSNLCINGKCVPPFENPSPILADCLANNLDPISTRFWKNQWGLTINTTKAEFATEFKNRLFEETCIGPTNYENPPQNETACLNTKYCNWNPDLNETQCLAQGNTDFCGFCPTPNLCWSLSIPSFCVIPGNESSCDATWISEFGVCANVSATETECTAGFWFPGIYNTPAKCSEGLCLGSDWGTPASECTTKHYCTRPCPVCTSTVFPAGACLKATTPLVCLTAGGKYHEGICLLPVNQTQCAAVTGVWSTCQSKSAATCYAGPASEILSCYVDNSAVCASQTDCEAQGDCNDDLLTSVSNNRAACIRPYFVDWNGEATCTFDSNNNPDSGWYDVKIGCLNPNVNELQCKAANYYWVERANSKDTCEQIKLCREPGKNAWTYKNESACVACGGDYVSVFHWNAGQWRQAEVIPLTFTQRKYDTTNTWGLGLSWTQKTFVKILNVLLQPIGTKMAYRAKANGFCRYSAFLYILQKIADNCGTGNTKRSIDAVGDNVLIGQFKAFSNLKQTFDAGSAYIEFNEMTLTTQDSTLISIYRYPASQLAASNPGTKKNAWEQSLENAELEKRGDPISSITLNVGVTNDNGIIIGEIVSDGYNIQYSPSIDGSYELCVAKRLDASPNTCFTTTDFVSGSPLKPLGMTITYEDSDSICANFPASSAGTTYYAVKRVQDWATVTEAPCPDTPNPPAPVSSASFVQISFAILLLIAIVLTMF